MRFAHRLALYTGIKEWVLSPERLLREMTWKQLNQWFAFYLLEPFGSEREDLRSELIASTVANVHRDPKRHPRPFDIRLPRHAPTKMGPTMTKEQWRAGIQGIKGAFAHAK